ncbi:class I SAM-dependent methyltransferase [Paenibacillus glycinis]|uniref:SAM-dependent methyltransferase n=1 Tax=Paenibacillus glycinis TaxID=2697035 RepID=A0ABW9XJM1_9BACL|nr:SAM-dependent methyltransferase [Paenibacillus glycinis]NBD22815.1 SAM-dependent methyltransferase [Paenibacillus glycinis]
MNRSRLEASIRDEIAASERRGWATVTPAADGQDALPAMTFRDYMARCLYDERDGYYRSGAVRIGKSGDFYTSSGIGTVLADKLAGYLAGIAGGQPRPATIAEWGAGTGALSRQMLSAWARTENASSWLVEASYLLVDGNPVHLDEARSRFGDWMREGASRLAFMTPEEAEETLLRDAADNRFAMIVANELLDAFPVHRVVRVAGRLWELGVAAAAESNVAGRAFRYAYMPLSDERIEAVLRRDGIALREGQIIEVNLEAEQWIARMAGKIRQGCMVLIDYGHEAGELAASHRMRGTLLCYKDHVARDEPFADPGGQDMTAHVNFTACMSAAGAAGWEIGYYGTQKQFLVDQGVLADLAAHDGKNPFGPEAKRNRAIRQLLLSDGMSETFKVLVLRK